VKNSRPTGVQVAPVPLGISRRGSTAADYIALTKPRLNLLVVATSAAAYYLGAPAGPAWWPLAEAVAGTALVASGAAVLNQVYERDTDALMRRTRQRPLPDGRVGVAEARVFGAVLAVLGIVWLAISANLVSAALAVATIAIYLVVYTPMKRTSSAATLVGAVPGALPPLIGWTAAHGSLSAGGWTLFAIVFLWQSPHFMAIAWLYREDYARAGFPMLPVVEPDGRRTGLQAIFYAAALVPASVAPTLVGLAGAAYFWTALILGVGLLWMAARFARSRTDATARVLFYSSITYLPLIWTAMLMDHR
jgi:protoheme IX farnesyltransferase